ncbi:uncharacterized protein NECHADRAFT_80154 [Fusarium vanettenii 77-13-4]|uniref:DUF7730 domain-containing protein n=1 Tax=Fusarium vanettenii (strain ATCC MYA-4622 / CBS 123669 / FGSC 9596 / NRRL 45880 / 77-13-4) TaxID=660122 RepID=C7Z191_FUSV7|nr:uncharacterized protein NECHADRAFT_80154 [Fusarium vanettenii 77-13-4]EEU42322.1 hypothetical protein NECHADRAFT_80154 [Fusarium vanettenii 77-13-4]
MPPVVFRKVGDQHKSPFFKKLPPEIRKMIYTELFGSRLVHVLFHSSVHRKPKTLYKRQGAPPRSKMPGWAHCVCRQGVDSPPHLHSERFHKWCYMNTNIIFSCKYAFEEGMPILYGSNVLSFTQLTDFLVFMQFSCIYKALITRVNVSVNLEGLDGRTYDFYTEFKTLLRWKRRAGARRLECQMLFYGLDDFPFVERALHQSIKTIEREALQDGPRFRLFVPLHMRESKGRYCWSGSTNYNVEIHWRSDNSPTAVGFGEASDDENYGMVVID